MHKDNDDILFLCLKGRDSCLLLSVEKNYEKNEEIKATFKHLREREIVETKVSATPI